MGAGSPEQDPAYQATDARRPVLTLFGLAEQMPDWDSMVLVGRVARPHGLRGLVVVDPETDFIEERFQVGGILWTRSANGEEALTIAAARLEGRRPLIGFEGFSNPGEARRLAGLELRIPEEALTPLTEGAYYQHQLVGCTVQTLSGDRVGEVARVDGGAAVSVLAIDGPRGEILIPLAEEICVEVDVEARRIRIKPPEGLLDLNETKRSIRASRARRTNRTTENDPKDPHGSSDSNDL